MLDIVGYIKVDEENPDRIKSLIACIRSMRDVGREGAFILKLQTPSEWLYNLVDNELKSFFYSYELYRSSPEEPLDYGKEYLQLLERTTLPYVLNFMEDHFMMGDSNDLFAMLCDMEVAAYRADVIRSTFHQVEVDSCFKIIEDYSAFLRKVKFGLLFQNTPENFSRTQHRWPRYYIGVNFITTISFARNFWNRDFVGKRPHEYEIVHYDRQWEHKCLVPEQEILASIDDDHGVAHSCLLRRSKEKASKFWDVWNAIDPLITFKMKDPIQLFHINNYEIKTEKLGNMLHGSIVRQFENELAAYVEAKYAVSFNSATSAIFLLLSHLRSDYANGHVKIPTLIPPVVPNAIINAGWKINFQDDPDWVGGTYDMGVPYFGRIIDSAQEVCRGSFDVECQDDDIVIYSFYPTKPIGSCDGGMIVSNNKDIIESLRILSLNGMSFAENNWDRKQTRIGHKMYMNSISAYMASENLKRLEQKEKRLDEIRRIYQNEIGCSENDASYHLFRKNVSDQKAFIEYMKVNSIVCGIHYEASHRNPLFREYMVGEGDNLLLSEDAADATVSLPFHEALTDGQVRYIIEAYKRYAKEDR